MGNRFSNRNRGGESLRQKAKGLAAQAEQQDQINKMVDEIIGDLDKRLTAVERLVAGLCDAVGMEAVTKAVHAREKAAGEAKVAAETAQLQAGIEAGYVIPVETVDERSFIVGIEHDKNGVLCEYGPQQEHFRKLSPEFAEALKGKKVGDKVTISTGNTFQLTGVFYVDAEKAKAYFEKQAAERAEAQKRAEAEAALKAAAGEQGEAATTEASGS